LQEKFHYDRRISICCYGNFSCLTVNRDEVTFEYLFTSGKLLLFMTGMADDKLETEIYTVLDTVNKFRSLKPPTDTTQMKGVYIWSSNWAFSLFYTMHDICLVVSCWLANTMSYCLFSHEQVTCFCTLLGTRYCCSC
jgi:hypothetical protein